MIFCLWYNTPMDQLQLKSLQKRIFIRGAIATFGTFILNTIGVWLSLYSILWWYDIPMHFLGGLFTNLLVIAFLLRFKPTQNLPVFKLAIVSLFCVLVIGLVWEGYEIFWAIFSGNRHLFMDSVSDIFFDLAGGIEAVFIYLRHRKIVLGK